MVEWSLVFQKFTNAQGKPQGSEFMLDSAEDKGERGLIEEHLQMQLLKLILKAK